MFVVPSILTIMPIFLLDVTRVGFSMSRDGLLPGWFSKTDRHGTPRRVTWMEGIASALLAGVFPVKAVADLTNIGILATFVVLCLSMFIFRYKKQDAHRTFRIIFMPAVPHSASWTSGSRCCCGIYIGIRGDVAIVK